MRRSFSLKTVLGLIAVMAATLFVSAPATYADHDKHHSNGFMGVKANTGSVTHYRQDDRQMLVLSDDFKVPDAPAPHWQIVDSKGNTYLLQRLQIKGDKFNKQITLPAYIRDVAKVQIWCAWAETLLGEASFASPVK